MISRTRSSGARPDVVRARRATSSTTPVAGAGGPDRLTAMYIGDVAGATPAATTGRRQASSSTQPPIGTISPVSSASGMKSSGAISRASGAASARAPRRRDGAGRAGRRSAGSAGRARRARARPSSVGLELEAFAGPRRASPARRRASGPCRRALAEYIATSALRSSVVDGVGPCCRVGDGDADAGARRTTCVPSTSNGVGERSEDARPRRSAASRRPGPRRGRRTRRRPAAPPCRTARRHSLRAGAATLMSSRRRRRDRG